MVCEVLVRVCYCCYVSAVSCVARRPAEAGARGAHLSPAEALQHRCATCARPVPSTSASASASATASATTLRRLLHLPLPLTRLLLLLFHICLLSSAFCLMCSIFATRARLQVRVLYLYESMCTSEGLAVRQELRLARGRRAIRFCSFMAREFAVDR